VTLTYQLDTVRSWCISTRPYQQRPFINKTLSTETAYQQGLIVDRWQVKSRYEVLQLSNSTSNVLVCETQRKVSMYGCVSEWVGSVCVCVCVLFVDLFQDDLSGHQGGVQKSPPVVSLWQVPHDVSWPFYRVLTFLPLSPSPNRRVFNENTRETRFLIFFHVDWKREQHGQSTVLWFSVPPTKNTSPLRDGTYSVLS